MMKYELRMLGNIANTSSGGTPDRTNEKYWNGNIPWVTTSLINFNKIDKAEEFITDEGLKNSSAKLFAKGTLLMAMYGQGITRGKVAILNIDAATNQACCGIIPNSKIIDTDFLFQYLSFQYDNIRKLSNGGSQENLSAELIKQIKIPVPSIAQQQHIAKILATTDELINKCAAIIEALENRNKGLAQQLLTGKMRVEEFEKTKWKKINADKVFVNHSQKNNTENEVLLSATQDRGMIPRDMLEGRVTMPTGDTNSYKLVDKGDFVISLRSFQGGLEYSEYRGLVSPAYTVLKPIKPINDIFYKFYFKSYNFIGHLSVAVIGIRDGKNISYENFATIIIPNPSIEEQQSIANILNNANNELKHYQTLMQQYQQLKKGLMQKLLTGKINVV